MYTYSYLYSLNHIIRVSSTTTSSMGIRLAHTDTDMLITNSSSLSSTNTSATNNTSSSVGSELVIVACTPYPRLFDARLRYTDTNNQHICIYMDMSITSHSSSTPQAIATQRASNLINILLNYYTSTHATSTHTQSPSLQPHLLEHIHIMIGVVVIAVVVIVLCLTHRSRRKRRRGMQE